MDHPLRVVREVVSTALAALSGDFAGLYSGMGRPSIPPEMLLRAMLLQAFYSIRSERQLMERLEFDLLFRWFVGLGVDEPVRDHSSFSTNRERLLDGDIAAKFLAAVLAQRIGGKRAKVALARKLAVILHRIWTRERPMAAV
jgi:transposase